MACGPCVWCISGTMLSGPRRISVQYLLIMRPENAAQSFNLRNPSMKDTNDKKKLIDKNDKSRNPDLITGAPGSHPVGTGRGAAAGGVATGAAIGTVAGPVGTIARAAVGAVVGGLAGKGLAEAVNPTAEAAYWRKNHERQPYAKGRSYDGFDAAYQNGYDGYARYGDKGGTYEEREEELRKRHEASGSKLAWSEARPASHAAWTRLQD